MRKSKLPEKDPSQKIVILYVDDEPNNLNAFLAHFRVFKDFIIYTARSGEEGLNILKVVQAQIIIADQKMPNMTGVEFLEETMQKPEPVKIVVTAHRDISAIETAYKNGRIFKYLEKPWNMDDLENAINEGYLEYSKSLNLS